jgi:nicotinamidase-related amidase
VTDKPPAWPLPELEFDLDPAHTALLVVDMQYYDAHADFGLGRAIEVAAPGYTRYYFDRVEHVVVPAIERLLLYFRAHGMRIIYLTYASETADGSDLNPQLRRRNAQRLRAVGAPSVYPRHTPEAAILSDLTPGDGDLVVNKTSQSAFTSTQFDHMLRNLDITGLVVTGVVTNVCVEATARDAADLGYRTVLVDDGCAAWDESFHTATLRSFRAFLGKVRLADEIIAELEHQIQS